MAHAKPEHLKDLKPVLDELRGWPRLKEKSPGIFYIGSKPFLHFHIEGVRLWADVKLPDGGWTEVAATTKADRAAFMKRVSEYYAALIR
ncbi:MAG: hypothetical protein WAW96_16760 [Alphaproteobacteria bacterium]